MKVSLQPILNDAHIDVMQVTSQRQLQISISAQPGEIGASVPLNLCLILDHSGSMTGRPLEMVKKAAKSIIDRLKPSDRISIVAFDHKAKIIVPNQLVGENKNTINKQISQLRADGGTAIDEGLKIGIEELAKGKKDAISQAFLLTDGENEHGDNDRCLKFAELAAEYNITLNSLGFGDHWNQDILEEIADKGGGTLVYIERAEQAVEEFSRLFTRIATVGLTNSYLLLSLIPNVRLAELKPIAQVKPDVIELAAQMSEGQFIVRLGDLMINTERVILANIYIGKFTEGMQTIATVQIRYDDPSIGATGLFSDKIPVEANFLNNYQPVPNAQVQQSILALAKYRQTQLAEAKLMSGDRAGAATMLQTAAKTALQMGDTGAATVLQTSATQLQAGQDLSEADRKKTRIVSKTVLQDKSNS